MGARSKVLGSALVVLDVLVMMCRRRAALTAVFAIAILVLPLTAADAQTLDPRAYVATPVASNLVVFGVTRSVGGVLVDPSLPIEDVHAKSTVATIGYVRVFGLLRRQASVYAVIPYAWGKVSGQVGDGFGQTSRSGLADAVFRFNFHFVGNPAMTPMEFLKARKRTIVGASLTVAPPSGQYYPEKLINLSTNRWAFKPEIGISHPAGRWLLDAYAGLWCYTSNSRFYPGTATKSQHPVASFQAHVSYNLTLRAWAAFDATWYRGGRTSLNGVAKADLQNNTRLGATLSLPVGRRHSVKAAYSWDIATAAGTGFDTLSIGWQVAWLDRQATKR